MTEYGVSLGGQSYASQKHKFGGTLPVVRLFIEGNLPLDHAVIQDPTQVVCVTFKGAYGVGPSMVNGTYDSNIRAFLRGLPAKRVYFGFFHEPENNWTPSAYSAAQEHFLAVVRDTTDVVAEIVTVIVFVAGRFSGAGSVTEMRAWMPQTVLPQLIGFDYDGNQDAIYPTYDEVHTRTKQFADSYGCGLCAPEYAHFALASDSDHSGRSAWMDAQVPLFEADNFAFVCWWDSHASTLTTRNEITNWATYMAHGVTPTIPDPPPGGPDTGDDGGYVPPPKPDQNQIQQPPRVAPQRKWTLNLFDTVQQVVYKFPLNPKETGSPWASRDVTWQRLTPLPALESGPYVGIRPGGRVPITWTFSGTMRDRRQHTLFVRALQYPFRMQVVTDLGEVHSISLTEYKVQRKAGSNNYERATWTITCQLFDELFVGTD